MKARKNKKATKANTKTEPLKVTPLLSLVMQYGSATQTAMRYQVMAEQAMAKKDKASAKRWWSCFFECRARSDNLLKEISYKYQHVTGEPMSDKDLVSRHGLEDWTHFGV